MRLKKWKKIVLISSMVLLLLSIIAIFWVIIVNTANINSKINISATDCLGTVAINIKNADNGMPYSYFVFENTKKGDEKTHFFQNKNLLFKTDTDAITIEFTIENQAYFKTKLEINNSGPGRNGKVVFMINGVEQEETDVIIFDALETKTISYVVSKQNPAAPIRAKYNMDLKLTRMYSEDLVPALWS